MRSRDSSPGTRKSMALKCIDWLSWAITCILSSESIAAEATPHSSEQFPAGSQAMSWVHKASNFLSAWCSIKTRAMPIQAPLKLKGRGRRFGSSGLGLVCCTGDGISESVALTLHRTGLKLWDLFLIGIGIDTERLPKFGGGAILTIRVRN